jgi:hypothetical protein
MRRHVGRVRLGLSAGWTVLALAGCQDRLNEPRIVSLVYVSGNAQSASIGDVLPDPLVVRVVDQRAQPAAGVEVRFTVLVGNGAVTPEVATSDAGGAASTSFRLGSGVGQQAVRASLGTTTPVVFTAEALPAPPSQITVVSGANQTATAGSPLPAPIVVRVTDAFNNPKAGVTVEFGVVTGGGTVSAASAMTNAQGQASVSWTLGPTVGTQTMTAVVAGVAPLIITATAQ